MRALLIPSLLSTLCVAAAGQATRVTLGGVPSNLWVDWSLCAAAPGAAPDTFVAVLPLDDLGPWMWFEPDASMDLSFGAGAWLRCTMTATAYAYLSPAACAHQPAAGASAPFSMLTTSYDWGIYDSSMAAAGAPLLPDLTWFPGLPVSTLQGLPGWTIERWQLRTRGYFPSDLWNACPGPVPVSPAFAGYVGAELQFAFQ